MKKSALAISIFFLSICSFAASEKSQEIPNVQAFKDAYDFINWFNQNKKDSAVAYSKLGVNELNFDGMIIYPLSDDQHGAEYYGFCEGYGATREDKDNKRATKLKALSVQEISELVRTGVQNYHTMNQNEIINIPEEAQAYRNGLGMITLPSFTYKMKKAFHAVRAGIDEVAVVTEVIKAGQSMYGYFNDEFILVYRSKNTAAILGFDLFAISKNKAPGFPKYELSSNATELQKAIFETQKVTAFIRCMLPPRPSLVF